MNSPSDINVLKHEAGTRRSVWWVGDEKSFPGFLGIPERDSEVIARYFFISFIIHSLYFIGHIRGH